MFSPLLLPPVILKHIYMYVCTENQEPFSRVYLSRSNPDPTNSPKTTPNSNPLSLDTVR